MQDGELKHQLGKQESPPAAVRIAGRPPRHAPEGAGTPEGSIPSSSQKYSSTSVSPIWGRIRALLSATEKKSIRTSAVPRFIRPRIGRARYLRTRSGNGPRST